MDRLQRIKGYADRTPKADVLWLIAEVERLADELRVSEAGKVAMVRLAGERKRELDALRGEVAAPRCPCGFRDDHAGWCPRR